MNIFGGYNAGLAPGAIMPVAQGTAVPDGFLLCDGSELSRTLYPELFAVIGTTYGEGDGETTFNIPAGIIRLVSENVPVYGVANQGLGLINQNGATGILVQYDVDASGNNRLANSGRVRGGNGSWDNIAPKGSAQSSNVYADLSGQYINLLIKYRW